MKTIIRMFKGAFIAGAAAIIAMGAYLHITVPDHYYLYKGDTLSINNIVSATANIDESKSIKNDGSSTTAEIKLFGIIPIKTVSVQSVDRPYLIPCGTPFGIKMLTDGVIVTGFGKIGDSEDPFELSPAGKAGIQTGDIITEVNGEKIISAHHMSELVAKNSEQTKVKYERDGQCYNTTIYPETDTDGVLKIGLWVRDSTAGIGTMTFYDPLCTVYGGLGHAVCDIDTGSALPLASGEIVPAAITSVKKGSSGIPGELCGTFIGGFSSGDILCNSESGIFGQSLLSPTKNKAVPMAFKQEITTGKAYILTTTDGSEPQKYGIEIESLDYSNSKNKNMIIKVTDERLLDKTGGIVQGMSGSPIIQNGMLVGAVTHVFVNDPTHGYGIFAETMYEQSAKIDKNLENAA